MGNLKGSARINVIRNIVTWWSGLGWAISLFLVVGALIVWEFVTPSKETGSDFLSVTAILMMAINITATLLIVRDVTARTRFYAEQDEAWFGQKCFEVLDLAYQVQNTALASAIPNDVVRKGLEYYIWMGDKSLPVKGVPVAPQDFDMMLRFFQKNGHPKITIDDFTFPEKWEWWKRRVGFQDP